MTYPSHFRLWIGIGLGFLLLFTSGCAGPLYGWTVRTTSTTLSDSSELADLGQEKIAVMTPLSVAYLRGSEAGMGQYLGDVIKKVAPNFNVVDERQTISLINKQGLTEKYAKMREELEMAHVPDRDILRNIGAALSSRYLFQPRLAHFIQEFLDRWELPGIKVKLSRVRSATMRLSLQLWDAKTGELLWSSTAESNFQSEALSQDPVFIEDVARVTFGSMLADLLNRKTSSKYTPYNDVLNLLILEKASPDLNVGHTGTTSEGGKGSEGKQHQD